MLFLHLHTVGLTLIAQLPLNLILKSFCLQLDITVTSVAHAMRSSKPCQDCKSPRGFKHAFKRVRFAGMAVKSATYFALALGLLPDN